MKALIVIALLSLIACRESDCDMELKALVIAEREYNQLKADAPVTYGKTHDMKIVRAAANLSMARSRYNHCVNGE